MKTIAPFVLLLCLVGAQFAHGADSGFVAVGEGTTGQRPSDRPRIGYRLHSAPDLTARLAQGETVARLKIEPEQITLRVGEIFALGKLTVVALNPLGVPIPAVPFAFEAEEKTPAPVDFSPLQTTDRIVGAAPGEIRLRFFSLLPAGGQGPAVDELTIRVVRASETGD